MAKHIVTRAAYKKYSIRQWCLWNHKKKLQGMFYALSSQC
jgi:hypothetical protein